MSRAAEAAAMMDTGRDTAAVQTVATHDENNAETGLRASVEVLGAVDKRMRASTKQAFEARVQGVPGSAVRVVADAGHRIHEGNPGVVARAIDEVLAAVGTR